MKNKHVFILALTLTGLALVLCYYKVSELNLPLIQEDDSPVWTVEARISYEPERGPASVSLILPDEPGGLLIIDEDFISANYGLALARENGQRIAKWTIRRPKGLQVLYYRAQLIPYERPEIEPEKVSYPDKKMYPEMMQTVVDALLEEVRSKTADTLSFTHELLVRLNAENPTDNIQLLHDGVDSAEDWVQRIISLLQGARIPARQVNLLLLSDGVIHGKLVPWLEVYNGDQWYPFDPESGAQSIPDNALIWSYGDTPLVSLKGGHKAKVDFSVYQQFLDITKLTLQKARLDLSPIMEFSLFNLPVQTQNVYRIILMIPVGAFLMVLFRNVIGITSFGTFMPILIAMAFRETELLWGLLLFTLIVALGLLLRFYLESLRLLLVPRLTAVLIIVIILMLLVSLVSHKLGLERGLSIALFPMVIMAMTIERMSLVWEERGAEEAMRQGLGTLFIASCGYLLMTEPHMEYLIFVFPELLLVFLALTLLLGRYTGYRLTEIWRFKALLHKIKP